jgi:His/Glu/Gln/Arg/opine family amino acid ABC transporter permease subunit
LLFKGLGVTCVITLFAIIIGLVLGCLLATIKVIYRFTYNLLFFSKLVELYTLIFRGTPLILQLLLLKATVFGKMNEIVCAIIVCGLNSSAYITELMYSSVIAIDISQYEAGLSLGMPQLDVLKYVIAPQAFKNAKPTLLNEFSSMLKETAVVGMIGILDLNMTARSMVSRTAKPTALYIAGLMYLSIVLMMTNIQNRFNYKKK